MHKKTILGLLLLITVSFATWDVYRPVNDTKGYFKRYIEKDVLIYNYNPRNISNLIAKSNNPPKSELNISMMEVFFAQFINHDLERNEFVNDKVFYMPVYPGDVLYGVNATNNYIIASASYGIYDSDEERFDVFNNNSKALDLSTIYGSDNDTNSRLRLYSGGKLKTSSYSVFLGPGFSVTYPNLPPSQLVTGLTTSSAVSTGPATISTSGDDRVNENIAICLINTAFIRRHNKHATEFASANPTWDDEKLYQEANKLTVAEYQHIVFDEYIPVVLGPLTSAIREYKRFDDEVDLQTSIEFASQAFRYGHSAVAPFDLIASNGSLYTYTIPAGIFGPFPITSTKLPFAGQLGGPLNLPTALFTAGGIDNIIRGLIRTVADNVDVDTNNVVRNIAFIGSIGRGVDLFAIDIFRARNNSAPSYYELRKKFYNIKSLPNGIDNIYKACPSTKKSVAPDDITCFDLITSNRTLALLLQSVYGKVTNIDGLVGLLAEDLYPGSDFSRTMAGIIIKEYVSKRDGDYYWYEKDGYLTSNELTAVKNVKFSDIISEVYSGSDLPENLFVVS